MSDFALEVFTLWASLKGEDPVPWMIAAEDDVAWQADPDRCEAVFRTARKLADDNNWDVREITFSVDGDAVADAFHATRTEAKVK